MEDSSQGFLPYGLGAQGLKEVLLHWYCCSGAEIVEFALGHDTVIFWLPVCLLWALKSVGPAAALP